MLNCKEIKKKFPFFKKNFDHVYFDNSATSLKPKVVIDSICNYYINYGTNIHNIDSDLGYKTNVKCNEMRNKIKNFINAKKIYEVIFTSGTTYGLNQIAYGLSDKITDGDEILITKQEHGSNILPWYRLAKKKSYC